MDDYISHLEQLQKQFKPRAFKLERPESEFPELFVTVPDAWPYVKLAPFYDVHWGHVLHDQRLFRRHLTWLIDEKYTLSWNGGDMIENAIIGSPGMFSQRTYPNAQHDASVEIAAPFQHKLLFAIPGNHEERTLRQAGFDIAQQFARDLRIPYFPDYCFCTIKWRGNNFRICAHHGTGAAATPGGQRNAARKDMPWVKADMYWTGHLHQPIADVVYQADFDQKTGRMISRNSVVIISPSYMRYFGGYAARKRLGPGALGISVATLQEDGRIAVELHAKGKRL